MCVSGVFVAIELKVDGGKLEALQEYKLQKIAKCGGIAIVMTPDNFDETYKFLSDIANRADEIFKEHIVIQ